MIAQADATLYGVAQYRGIAADDSSFENQMAKTRMGVKGTVDNDIEGLTTGFQFEWEFDGNGSSTGSTNTSSVALRKSNVYLKGDFGTAVFGRQNNPVEAAEGKRVVLGKHGDNYALVPDRVGRSAGYVSPDFGGANVYLVLGSEGEDDTATTSSDDVDTTTYGLNWSGMGIGFSAGMHDIKDTTTGTDTADITSVGASYSGVENLYVGASWSQLDPEAATASTAATAVGEATTWGVGATYTIGKVKLIADFEDTETEYTDLTVDGSRIGVGVSYALGAKAAVAVEYFDFDSDAEKNFDDKDTLVLQYTLSF
jgi:hypothetical protein